MPVFKQFIAILRFVDAEYYRDLDLDLGLNRL